MKSLIKFVIFLEALCVIIFLALWTSLELLTNTSVELIGLPIMMAIALAVALLSFGLERLCGGSNREEDLKKHTKENLESIRRMINYFENKKSLETNEESIKKLEFRVTSLKKIEIFLFEQIARMTD